MILFKYVTYFQLILYIFVFHYKIKINNNKIINNNNKKNKKDYG